MDVQTEESDFIGTYNFFSFFFFIWVFFHVHSRITGLQGKGEGISLTPHYHFHSLHRHLDISWAITAESSPLHIPSSRTRTRNLWFLSASRLPLRIWTSRRQHNVKMEKSSATEHSLKCHCQMVNSSGYIHPKTSRKARYKSRV